MSNDGAEERRQKLHVVDYVVDGRDRERSVRRKNEREQRGGSSLLSVREVTRVASSVGTAATAARLGSGGGATSR